MVFMHQKDVGCFLSILHVHGSGVNLRDLESPVMTLSSRGFCSRLCCQKRRLSHPLQRTCFWPLLRLSPVHKQSRPTTGSWSEGCEDRVTAFGSSCSSYAHACPRHKAHLRISKLLILTMALHLAAALALVAALQQPQCGYQNCSQYCSGKCPFRPNISKIGTE
jgi:hypothetical protein